MLSLSASDVLPLADFKATAPAALAALAKHNHPILLTQNGRAAAVLLSPAAFDALVAQERVRTAIAEGLADAEAGRGLSTVEMRANLATRLGQGE